MKSDELFLLENALKNITAKAREFGLDFYNMHFEICPVEIIYTFGAYGMPTRYAHWSYGKAYHKMKTQYDYNLSRIYEMVINSNPCYAFLLEGNSLIQNKLVIAHVLAHSDFFKNNVHFKRTPSEYILDSMANAAQRLRAYEFQYGKDKVEKFLDAVLSIQEHINPYYYLEKKKPYFINVTKKERGKETPYDDLWELDQKAKDNDNDKDSKPKTFPAEPQKDLLLFLMEHAKSIEDWQRDVISIVRQDMLYFWPQLETKIMNEGWATYWHLRILREIELTEKEVIYFAKMHAEVTQPSPWRINPYYLGLKIFEDIERKWNNPTDKEKGKFRLPGGEGREKVFEVRATENDISFLRNYLTKELIKECDLYVYEKKGQEWRITDKNWEMVRDNIVFNLINGGYPYLTLENGDYNNQGELYLKHHFEGVELDVFYLENTLPHIYNIWGRPVHLETIVDKRNVLFTCSGTKVVKKYL